MNINTKQHSAYVWLWLPNAEHPVPCGYITAENQHHIFTYDPTYLARHDAFALDPIELPLIPGKQRSHFDIHRAIRDAAPDSWGRRVILYQQQLLSHSPSDEFTEIDFLLASDANRIGALHFQLTDNHYSSVEVPEVNLKQLQQVTEKVESGAAIPSNLYAALFHGTSIGGARPKAFLNDGDSNIKDQPISKKQLIAKFSSQTDFFPIVKAEFAAMQTAKMIGLDVAETQLLKVLGKDVILVTRFDRKQLDHTKFAHYFMISALTALQLHEMEARYASYLDLADFIRKYAKEPEQDLIEIYRRMVFNILIGNTDDHARNHAFFWGGRHYKLTPAYDICPMLRVGHIASQAMQVGKHGGQSTLANALSGCERFGLNRAEAKLIQQEIVEKITMYWPEMCDLAQLSQEEQQRFQQATVLSEYCFQE